MKTAAALRAGDTEFLRNEPMEHLLTKIEEIGLFESCVNRSHDSNWHKIECRLGLWSVFACDKQSVEKEAWKYWKQYYSVGEYDSILNLVGKA